MEQNRSAAAAGFIGVALNLAAVVFLAPIEAPYAPGNLNAWLASTRLHPDATVYSAWAFTIGLVSLAAFAAGVAYSFRNTSKAHLVVTGATIFAAAALLDAAGTLAPIAVLHVNDDNIGRTLLLATLYLDSAFNGLLGAGILCMSIGLPDHFRWLRRFGMLAGLIAMPVFLQFTSDTFAALLKVSAPLWLTWVLWVCSVLLSRSSEA
jgi:hypothetical protein